MVMGLEQWQAKKCLIKVDTFGLYFPLPCLRPLAFLFGKSLHPHPPSPLHETTLPNSEVGKGGISTPIYVYDCSWARNFLRMLQDQ